MPAPSPPCATYRLQSSRNFTFRDAERLVPYLHALGVSRVYASPYLKARVCCGIMAQTHQATKSTA